MTKLSEAPESRKKGAEVLAYFGVVLSEQLGNAGLPEDSASKIALDVMDIMKFEFGGQNIYFPRGRIEQCRDKADEVYAKFMNGESIQSLAHEFGHSIQWIYQMIAQVRARLKAEREAARTVGAKADYQRWKKENGRG
ncbi:hypothetical protein ATQ06_13005 [Salmonella enterica]|nr:hypothetical protein [Salmonella enterica]EAW0612451.1 hypothetical protein [Salmonella enterica]